MKSKQTIFFGLLMLWASAIFANDITKPVSPRASKEAKAILQFFYDISGKYTLTGQHNFPDTKSRNSEFYARYLGKTRLSSATTGALLRR